jgi:hypothetical protein
MSRALIIRPEGTVEELDLTDATPDEQERAITHHNELELIRALIRALEKQHGLD